MKNNPKAFLQKYKVDAKKVLSLIAIFVLLKSLVYISPLVLGEITNVKAFGEFEYTFNIGIALVGILSFGLPGAYAFFVLKQGKKELIPVFHLHFIILTVILLLAVVVRTDLLGNLIFGSLVVGVTMADQILVASILKAEGKNNLSVVVDTGVYIVLTLIVAVCFLDLVTFDMSLWFTSVLVYQVLFSLVCHARHLRKSVNFKWVTLRLVYGFGVLILFASPLFALISSSTRLYIEHYADLSNVGYYSFYFRLGSVLLILYRVLSILLFRKLFLETHEKLDKFVSLIILALLGVASFIFIVFNTPLGEYIVTDQSVYYDYAFILPFCLFQIIFWIAAAFFESIMVRENLVKQFIILLTSSLLLLIGSLWAYSVLFTHDLLSIVTINTFVIFLLFQGQQFILRKKGIRYTGTTKVHLGIGIVYIIFLVFN